MKVAIIGAGIVGSTTAYTLRKNGVEVKLFDAGLAQGTSAAVGIICPWVNQRRNKKWYKLANEGASFYLELIKSLKHQDFYQNNGTLITHPTRLDKLYELALTRLPDAPAMRSVSLLNEAEMEQLLPDSIRATQAIFVEGGAQVDGKALVKTLLNDQGIDIINKEVKVIDNLVDGEHFDKIVIATGPWINEVSDLKFDVYPQKGQLVEIDKFFESGNYPVLMPHGELDILFGEQGKLVIGASHENHKNDTLRDLEVEDKLVADASYWVSGLDLSLITNYRIGIRAYTDKNEPFFGLVEGTDTYVASGLGSSGLTVGPLIGHRIAMHILGESVDFSDFNPNLYKKNRGA